MKMIKFFSFGGMIVKQKSVLTLVISLTHNWKIETKKQQRTCTDGKKIVIGVCFVVLAGSIVWLILFQTVGSN